MQKVELVKLIKDIPGWRPAEGQQTADPVPGTNSTPPPPAQDVLPDWARCSTGTKPSCKRSGFAPETQRTLTGNITAGAYFSPFPFTSLEPQGNTNGS